MPMGFLRTALRSLLLVGGLAGTLAAGCAGDAKGALDLAERLEQGIFVEYGQPARSFVISGEMIRSGSAKVLLEGGDEAHRESA